MPMNDCTNEAVRDVLPLLASGGQVTSPADVEAHVAGCDACREELAVLKAARQALLRGPVVDVARIAGAIPAYRSASEPDPKVVSIASRRAIPRSWRIAAAALLVAGAGTALAVRQASDDGLTATTIAASEGVGQPAAAVPAESVTRVGTVDRGGDPGTASTLAGVDAGMTFGGGLDDLSEEDLVALLAVLDEDDSLAPTDPDETFPGVLTDSEEEI